MSAPIKVKRSRTSLDLPWDAFLRNLPGAHFEQTSAWGVLRSNYGWRPVRWIAYMDGEVVGGLQLLTLKIGSIGEIGYVMRGPMCRESIQDLQESLVDSVIDYAKKHRLIYLVFDHPYPDNGLSRILEQRGFGFHPKGIPPSGLIRATLLLDLNRQLECLKRGFSPRVRRTIQRAERSGLLYHRHSG